MGEDIGKERDKHWNKTGKKLGAKGGTEIERIHKCLVDFCINGLRLQSMREKEETEKCVYVYTLTDQIYTLKDLNLK